MREDRESDVMHVSRREFVAAMGAAGVVSMTGGRSAADAPAPAQGKAIWDMEKAYRQTTPTHEWICINGLWRWQPESNGSAEIPSDDWGFFKVPGCWPGISDYMQKDSQSALPHANWRDLKYGAVTAAWYQREITIPRAWAGRRIRLYAEYLNSGATVYLDGKNAGVMLFPAGEVDLTELCRPGTKQVLTMLVVALPLKSVMNAYNDTNSVKETPAKVARRGLCGDVYLIGSPKAERVEGVKIDSSVRKGSITFNATLDGLQALTSYRLKATVTDAGRMVKEFMSAAFTSADLAQGRFAFTSDWKPEKLWDIHTPKNLYEAQVTLIDGQGKVLDVFRAERFGFREFWIQGRDFYLNDTRIYLSAVPLDNCQVGAMAATYDAVCESLRRLKSWGVNYVYTHNYNCQPGSHLSFAEALRAADDVGMLVGVSQPHCSDYDWSKADAEASNNYARHAAFYVRVCENHPSVVFYVTSHNATGYGDDMNPDKIDANPVPRSPWSQRNMDKAVRAAAIIRRLDPARIVYHHSSGNLEGMYTVNFYANFAPIQEMDDWLEHWAKDGRIPFFTCEYATPMLWDWAMYRGWYGGKREFGSADVPWELCVAGWNAQFMGDAAYQISEAEAADMRWEAKRFRAGAIWHRWDYPHDLGSPEFSHRALILARYTTDNWRAFRTWGLSANSAWDYSSYWKLRSGIDKSRHNLKVDWEHLQRPGFSADFIDQRYERMDLAYEASDWLPTPAADALLRNNMPLLAYIAGKAEAFTSKDHNFFPGQSVAKQVIVINNSREAVEAECSWSLGLPQPLTGTKKVTVKAGEQMRIPVSFALPASLQPGAYEIKMTVRFSTGESQSDAFEINVPASPAALQTAAKIAIFDPKGETAKVLRDLGVRVEMVAADADLAGYDVLIVGKQALTATEPAPDIGRVREGLKAVIFEQMPEVLEKRFGLRIAQYGLRNVFARTTDHPLLAGLSEKNLHDWTGEATLQPPRLTYTAHGDYDQCIRWCDIPVTQVWRCENRGNVASVLIEKPGCGNFFPVVDGGFSLQYSPLLEYRDGRGMVLFCQMDICGRTESDPAAQVLLGNIVRYVSAWKAGAIRSVSWVGEPAGKECLQAMGFAPSPFAADKLAAEQVLVVGPGAKETLAKSAAAIAGWLNGGGHVLAFGLDEAEARTLLPEVRMARREHIAATFEASAAGATLAGVGPADVYSAEPRTVPLVTAGARTLGDGVLAWGEKQAVTFCQLVPWSYNPRQQNAKRTYRHLAFLASRLLGNMGVSAATPLLDRFHKPVAAGDGEHRWLSGFYLDVPAEWDYPYRFFRW